ncbi:methionyl-tRNA synthetase [Enterococcus termitis]|nr:methionyl-tRNA synthetase [Enterococcus termitis]
MYIELRDEIGTSDGTFLQVTPYFLIKTSDEGYSMFSPTPCDVLATDWKIVTTD